MNHFRMKLQAPNALTFVSSSRNDIVARTGEHTKPGRESQHSIAMTHPNLKTGRESREDRVRTKHIHDGFTELALIARNNLAAHVPRYELKPVTDAKDRDA